MRIMRRPVASGYGITNHPGVHITAGFPGRPVTVCSVPPPWFAANMSGPTYNGMDPSDPATYMRPWNPQPGMVARLNFDGAARQAETPTGGLQRGKTGGGRRILRVGGVDYRGR